MQAFNAALQDIGDFEYLIKVSKTKDEEKAAMVQVGKGVKALADTALEKLDKCKQPGQITRECHDSTVPDVQWQMDRLGSKVPTLKQYEKKLDVMNELKPELKDIVSDINKITDTSDVE